MTTRLQKLERDLERWFGPQAPKRGAAKTAAFAVYPDGSEHRIRKHRGLGYLAGGIYYRTAAQAKETHREAGATIERRPI